MSEIKVYGASDDLIEVERDGEPWAEFDAWEGQRFLRFSDGTVLRAEFNQVGVWRIELDKAGTASCERVPCSDDPDEDVAETDEVYLNGDIAWVDCWRNREPDRDELIDAFEWIGLDHLGTDELLRVYDVLKGRTDANRDQGAAPVGTAACRDGDADREQGTTEAGC